MPAPPPPGSRFFNTSARPPMSGGKGTRGFEGKPSSMPTREKPGFNTTLPGKAQPKDRSGGVKRVPSVNDKGL